MTLDLPRCRHAVAVERFGLLCIHGRLFQPWEPQDQLLFWGTCSKCSKVARRTSAETDTVA